MEPEPGRKPTEQAGPLPGEGDFVQKHGWVPGGGHGHAGEPDAHGKAKMGLTGVDPDPVSAQDGSDGREQEIVRQGEGDHDGKDGEEEKCPEGRGDPPASGDPFTGQRPSARTSAARAGPREGGARRRRVPCPPRRAPGRRPPSSRTASRKWGGAPGPRRKGRSSRTGSGQRKGSPARTRRGPFCR